MLLIQKEKELPEVTEPEVNVRVAVTVYEEAEQATLDKAVPTLHVMEDGSVISEGMVILKKEPELMAQNTVADINKVPPEFPLTNDERVAETEVSSLTPLIQTVTPEEIVSIRLEEESAVLTVKDEVAVVVDGLVNPVKSKVMAVPVVVYAAEEKPSATLITDPVTVHDERVLVELEYVIQQEVIAPVVNDTCEGKVTNITPPTGIVS